MISMHTVTILTLGVVIVHIIVMVKALRYALILETTEVWKCETVDLHHATKVLILQACVSFILALLKSWAVFDVFLRYWAEMPHTYHIRAYAFLAENYAVALLGFCIISFIRRMGDYHTRCVDKMKEQGVEVDRRKSING